jgi:Uma2 family endonuclease
MTGDQTAEFDPGNHPASGYDGLDRDTGIDRGRSTGKTPPGGSSVARSLIIGGSPMSTITPTMPVMTPAVPSPLRPRRITVDEYERIILSGALKDPDGVELVDGFMVDKMAKSPQHGYSTRKALDGLVPIIGPGWTWRSEQPLRIPDYDEPEPDVVIVKGSTEDYAYRIPIPQDVGLLIEVSLTTLAYDRGEKRAHYARVGIPVYWIINLVEGQVEVYADPGPDGYAPVTIYRPGQHVPVLLGGRDAGSIAVDTILPPPPPGKPATGSNA